MKTIKVQCPAKINLTLKVTGRRPDGFHNIESIMQTISLYDYLTVKIEPVNEQKIILNGTSTEIPYNEKNLVWKAANLFFETLDSVEKYSVEVFIEKNIPVAAGLAGGSTNAAGTLFALNELLDKPFGNEKIHELCAKLGSDLNFCLEGGRKMTSGRGEKLEELPFEDGCVSLIKPVNLGISAKEAYTKFSEKKALALTGRENFVNDLEWAVIDDYKELQTIKKNYPNAIMSGSGPTYYAYNTEFLTTDENFITFNGLKFCPNGVKII